jgi:hypothetical protein
MVYLIQIKTRKRKDGFCLGMNRRHQWLMIQSLTTRPSWLNPRQKLSVPFLKSTFTCRLVFNKLFKSSSIIFKNHQNDEIMSDNNSEEKLFKYLIKIKLSSCLLTSRENLCSIGFWEILFLKALLCL